MQIICTALQADNHVRASSLKFYRADALSDAHASNNAYYNEYCYNAVRKHHRTKDKKVVKFISVRNNKMA